MKKAISLVLSLSMLVSMLAACGGDTADSSADTTDSSNTSSNTSASTGVTGDNVVSADEIEVDFSQEPEGVVAGSSATIASSTDIVSQLLPYTFNGGLYFYSCIYDSLFWDANNTGVADTPLLVESYTTSDDHLTWVLNLHEDVYFHNGNNLTADSVIGSIDFYDEYDLVTIMGDIVSYEATGDYQVTFVLNNAGAEVADFLSLYVFDYTCYEEYGYTPDAGVGAGSGPYEIVDYAIGDNIILKAVEDLWSPERQAHIENVTLKIISNSTTIYNALAAGELNFAQITDYSAYELLVDSDDHTIFPIIAGPSIIWFNADGFCEYLDNPVVREALIMLVDAEQVMLAATGGYGVLGVNPLNLAFADYYSSERTYDPDAALAMLEAEGIDPSDIELTAIVNSASTAPYANIQAQLMDYGITLNFTGTDQNVVMTAGMAGEWDLWAEHGGLGALAVYTNSVKNFWAADAAQVVVTVPEIRTEVADMVTYAVNTLDIDEFYATLADICQLLDENYLYLCSYQSMYWGIFTNDVQNPSVGVSNVQWRIYDSWMAE